MGKTVQLEQVQPVFVYVMVLSTTLVFLLGLLLQYLKTGRDDTVVKSWSSA
jgi:hypothetical protein